MAHRPLVQIAITGARVFGRAFAEAWRQASAAQAHARSNPSASSGNPLASRTAGLTLDEACKILNVPSPKEAKGGIIDMEGVMERFKKLFDLNEPKNGGSFYLQSKVLRARERIEMETKETEEKADMKRETQEGWKPKVYKDR